MSEEPVTVTEVEARRADWVSEHIAGYIATRGAEGHVVDFTPIGGHPFSTTLLIRTIGRKSGAARITALTYGSIDGKVIVIASKGGADVHPAWYLNLQGHDTVDIQIGGQAFRAGRAGGGSLDLHGAGLPALCRLPLGDEPQDPAAGPFPRRSDPPLRSLRGRGRQGLRRMVSESSIPPL